MSVGEELSVFCCPPLRANAKQWATQLGTVEGRAEPARSALMRAGEAAAQNQCTVPQAAQRTTHPFLESKFLKPCMGGIVIVSDEGETVVGDVEDLKI